MLQLRRSAIEDVLRLASIAAARVEDAHQMPITNHLIAHDLIRTRLGRGSDHLSRDLVWSLNRPIQVACHLRAESQNAYEMFRGVLDAIGPTHHVADFDDEEAWVDALEIARRYRVDTGVDLYPARAGDRASIVSAALARLAEKGFEYEITPHGVGLTGAGLERACARLEVLVRRLGGLTVAAAVFGALQASGRMYRGLFLYGRTTSQVDQVRDPSVPWHFLYNLALKHLVVKSTSLAPQSDWEALLALARDVGAGMDVEEYSSYAGVGGISPFMLHQAIIDNTFYDELFSFQQWSSEGAEQLFGWWLDALDEIGCMLPLAPLETWRALARSLIRTAHPHRLVRTTPLDHASFEMGPSATADLLKSLAVPANQVNRDYRTPVQTPSRDAPFFPLIALPGGGYVLQPRGLAARGLYEQTVKLMRKTGGRRLNVKLGAVLERLAEKVLRETGHAPSVVGARYDHPTLGKSYEFDLAVETDHTLVLIECKMKALTRAARGLDTMGALSDFTKGYIETYAQLLRHEIALRVGSPLVLDNRPPLDLSGRKIQRIVLTMLDHGSLQNRQVLRNIIRAFANMTLSSEIPELAEPLDEINETVKEVYGHLATLAELAGQPFWDFMQGHEFGNWWLSVDQLALLAAGVGDLTEALAPIRHITFQTGDLMNEFAYAQDMALWPAA